MLVRTTQDLCFEQNKKNITIFHLKIMTFTAVKNCSILHRRVFSQCTVDDKRENTVQFTFSKSIGTSPHENLSLGFPTRFDTKWVVLPQEMAKG